MVVETQAELARRRLDAHDYNEAARQAERALKLDPENAAALDVLGKARRAQEQIRTAVDEARAALAEGDGKKAAEGFWTLLQISPDDPAAAELAPSVDAAFRARAEEARRLMTATRDAAQKAQHSRSDMIRDGDERSREGEAALQARTYAVAARHFMRARERFQRALR
jgi:tetratricopeptide (TPR) repeat protein